MNSVSNRQSRTMFTFTRIRIYTIVPRNSWITIEEPMRTAKRELAHLATMMTCLLALTGCSAKRLIWCKAAVLL